MNKYNRDMKEKAAARRKHILSLRKQKLTWQEIAVMYGVTRQRAQQLGKNK
jgi:DNA-directed RNA polymerase specialized sigma subunit